MQAARTALELLRFDDRGQMVAAMAWSAGPGPATVLGLILFLFAGWRSRRRLATGWPG